LLGLLTGKSQCDCKTARYYEVHNANEEISIRKIKGSVQQVEQSVTEIYQSSSDGKNFEVRF
jgi:hypothetical protein